MLRPVWRIPALRIPLPAYVDGFSVAAVELVERLFLASMAVAVLERDAASRAGFNSRGSCLGTGWA